jgi:Cys-tRNA synthase (O-phospho-L-seryl-tRNA:Cys-tRNA synthase)
MSAKVNAENLATFLHTDRARGTEGLLTQVSACMHTQRRKLHVIIVEMSIYL